MAESMHSSNATAAAGRVAEQTREGATQLRDKAGEVAKNLQEAGSQAAQAAQERLSEFRDTASDYLEQGRDRMHDMAQSLEGQIRNQPVRSILIAAGVGFLIGALFVRR